MAIKRHDVLKLRGMSTPHLQRELGWLWQATKAEVFYFRSRRGEIAPCGIVQMARGHLIASLAPDAGAISAW